MRRYGRALSLEESLLGPAGPFRPWLATGLAGALLAVGNPQASAAAAESALEAAQRSGQRPVLARALVTLAMARRTSGAPDPAIARRAHAAARSPLERADALVELGLAGAARHRERAATRALERAAAALEEAGETLRERLGVVRRLLASM